MAKQLSDGLHCRACDAQLTEHSYDRELCNKCMEVVWGLTDDIDAPDDDLLSIEYYDEEEHF